MNNKILLIPNVGIEFKWNKILFWTTIEKVIYELWKPDKIYSKEIYYIIHNHQILFEFNEQKLVYIEVSYEDNNLVYIENINVFQEKVEQLIKSLANKYWNYKSNDKWYSYDFTNINLSLRRESKPEDFEEYLWENDYQKWFFFNTVGIWVNWYYDNI